MNEIKKMRMETEWFRVRSSHFLNMYKTRVQFLCIKKKEIHTHTHTYQLRTQLRRTIFCPFLSYEHNILSTIFLYLPSTDISDIHSQQFNLFV